MAEKYFKFNHGCNKSESTADELVLFHTELSGGIDLHCSCSDCKRVLVLDMSQECDSGYRKLLRRMFVRQQIVSVPDEIYDQRQYKDYFDEDLLNYTVDFKNKLAAFPDKLVGHRELQDDWEDIVIQLD